MHWEQGWGEKETFWMAQKVVPRHNKHEISSSWSFVQASNSLIMEHEVWVDGSLFPLPYVVVFQKFRHKLTSKYIISVGTICFKSNSFWGSTYYLLISLVSRAVLILKLFMCYLEFDIFRDGVSEEGKLGTTSLLHHNSWSHINF